MRRNLLHATRGLLGAAALMSLADSASALTSFLPLGNLASNGLSVSDKVPQYAWDGSNNGSLGWVHNSKWYSFTLPSTASVSIKMTAESQGINPAFSVWSYVEEPDWNDIGSDYHAFNQVQASSASNANDWLTPVTGFIGYANSGPTGWTNGDGNLIGDGGASLPGSTWVATLNSGSAELKLKNLPQGKYLIAVGGSCHTANCAPTSTNYGLKISLEPDSTNAPPTVSISAGSGTEYKIGDNVTLTSTASDPEGGPLAYLWQQVSGPEAALGATDAPSLNFTAPNVAGSAELEFRLTVTDQDAQSSSASIKLRVDDGNAPPTVSIIPDLGTTEYSEGDSVPLSSAASDPEGGALMYQWQQVSGPAAVLSGTDTPSLSFTAPSVGTGSAQLAFKLTVTDDHAHSASASITLQVDDNPDLLDCTTAQPSRSRLWPADKTMRPVKVTGLTGPAPDSLSITHVTQDEPVVDKAARNASHPDARVRALKPAKGQAQNQQQAMLRAERLKKGGFGNGRVYTVHFKASGGSGSCEGSVQVSVPPKKGATAVDDGQNYSSTGQ